MLGISHPASPEHRPTCTCYGRTPIQAPGNCLSSLLCILVYRRVCVSVCMHAAAMARAQTHTHRQSPLHTPSVSAGLARWTGSFISHAIPLLASEAFLYYTHITIALRGSLLFSLILFSGRGCLMIGHVWVV